MTILRALGLWAIQEACHLVCRWCLIWARMAERLSTWADARAQEL
jgi:hypothetical protein